MSADPTYVPKVHSDDDGDTLVLESGAKLEKLAGSAEVEKVVVISSTPRTVLASESGTIFIVDIADCVFNLPAVVAGLKYTFIVKTLSTTTGAQVSPQTADSIAGAGLSSAANKDLINDPGTDAEGDKATLIGDDANTWWIDGIVGTWSKES
jgi:hypothetical protein